MIDILNRILSSMEFGFTVGELLKVSGQRSVHMGEENQTKRACVVKMCHYNATRIARIQREIKILNALDSEFFPKIYKDHYLSSENIVYYTDNLNPRTDAELLREVRESGISPVFITVEEFVEHIPWSAASAQLREERQLLDFLHSIFSALSILWEKEIIHRDLKPDNILVRPDLRPVIIDLGIAKSLRPGTADLTSPFFSSPCTPRYAAYEQLATNTAGATYKTDQFAVGVVAFEILAGILPYGDYEEIGGEALLTNMCEKSGSQLLECRPDISPELAAFVHRLIEKEPYKRFRNAEGILETLDNIRRSL